MTITGQAGVTLISESKKNLTVSRSCLKLLGLFLMYVNDHILPETPFPHAYHTEDGDELRYLRMFGEQLGLNEAGGLERFRFPAVSILINDILYPHMDLMNPWGSDDYTMAFSLVIPLIEIPSKFSQYLSQEYPNGVPLCIVIYRRRCLEILKGRKYRWNDFVQKCEHERSGRKLLLDMVCSANTYADYVGTFWSKQKRSILKDDFAPQPIDGSKFKRILSAAVYPEAVDKMVRHMLFLELNF